MKRNLSKIWKSVFSTTTSLLLCAPFLSISSCSTNEQTGEFNVDIAGDTSLVTFLNTTAIVGQDYVSVIRFKQEHIEISNFTISCGKKILTSEEYHYDNIRNELTVFGKHITQRSLKIQFSIEHIEMILEPEKIIDGVVTLDTESTNKKYVSSAVFGPFEYINQKSSIEQLNLSVEEVLPSPSPSTLGNITVALERDTLQPDSVFYISLTFEGNPSSLVPGNIPPGSHQFHIMITTGEQENRTLLDSSDYYVNFNFGINDRWVDPAKRHMVAQINKPEGSAPINCIAMTPKDNETLFYLQNLVPEIKALPISEIPLSMEMNLIGTAIPTLHPQLLGDITNFGFTINVSVKDWQGTYNAEIIFKYQDQIIYDNKTDYTISFDTKILEIETKETTAIPQDFDKQKQNVRSKVTFGTTNDKFVLCNYDYNKDDLEVIPLANDIIQPVEGSGQLFLDKEKGTFTVSMEYYTPNFSADHYEDISFIVQSKDKTFSQTFSGYKVNFETTIKWKGDIPELLSDSFLEKSTKTGQNNTVGVIRLPTISIYYPPMDVLANINVVAEEVLDSSNGEPILGPLSVHDIKMHDYLEFDIFLEFDNINSLTLTTASSTTNLNVTITVLDKSIELKNQQLLIRPLRLITPEENTFKINHWQQDLMGFQCVYAAEGTETTPVSNLNNIPIFTTITFPESSLFEQYFETISIFSDGKLFGIHIVFALHLDDYVEVGHTENNIKISLHLKRIDEDVQVDFDKTITLVKVEW